MSSAVTEPNLTSSVPSVCLHAFCFSLLSAPRARARSQRRLGPQLDVAHGRLLDRRRRQADLRTAIQGRGEYDTADRENADRWGRWRELGRMRSVAALVRHTAAADSRSFIFFLCFSLLFQPLLHSRPSGTSAARSTLRSTRRRPAALPQPPRPRRPRSPLRSPPKANLPLFACSPRINLHVSLFPSMATISTLPSPPPLSNHSSRMGTNLQSAALRQGG